MLRRRFPNDPVRGEWTLRVAASACAGAALTVLAIISGTQAAQASPSVKSIVAREHPMDTLAGFFAAIDASSGDSGSFFRSVFGGTQAITVPKKSVAGDQPESSVRIVMAGEVDPRFEHHSAVRLIGRERPFRAFDPIRDIPFRVQAGDAASANTPGAQLIYVLDPVDKPLVALLATIYPAGQAQEHRDRYDRLHFLSFAVGIAQAQAMQGLVGNFYPAAQPDGAP